MSGEANLPERKDTVTIFGKGKQLSDDRYKVIISAWDQCLDLSTEIGKKNDWKQCKIVTHHQHCFNLKMEETFNNLQVCYYFIQQYISMNLKRVKFHNTCWCIFRWTAKAVRYHGLLLRKDFTIHSI